MSNESKLVLTLGDQEKYELEQWNSIDSFKKETVCEQILSILIETDQYHTFRAVMEEFEGSWWLIGLPGFHETGGRFFRNWLREAQWGEEFWGVDNLDYIYIKLLETAVMGKTFLKSRIILT